jgi:excisionase family DNA binding protein
METELSGVCGLEPLLSIEDLARYLGVPVATIYDWRVDGKGPRGIRVGRHVKFTASDVKAWLAKHREPEPGAPHLVGGDALMARPRTPVGTFGDIQFETAANGRVRARTRYRDDDGRLRRVQATGMTRKSAERALKEQLACRAHYAGHAAELTPDSAFTSLVDVWLDDLDLEGRLAHSTRSLYERNMRTLVLPTFRHFTLREITVSKVDRFLKTKASKSYSMAKQAKVVLSLALGLAVRYEAIPRNPVAGTARLRKPPSATVALTADQVEAIRQAVRSWRRGRGPSASGCRLLAGPVAQPGVQAAAVVEPSM